MARVKICGIKTIEMIDVAVDAGADMVGLVFFPNSPRNVTLDEAQALTARVKARAGINTSVVALLVDPTDDLVRAVTDVVQPDYLQLHGHETPDRVVAIRQIAAKPIIKALPVSTVADTRAQLTYRLIELVLFDAKPPTDATLPGGNGLAFDWSILAEARAHAPFMLSGGLTPLNVADAIRIADPLYVDVSSGVERKPGEKDADLIRAFIAAARGMHD